MEEKKPTPVKEEEKTVPEKVKAAVIEEIAVAEAPQQERPVPTTDLAPQQPQPEKPTTPTSPSTQNNPTTPTTQNTPTAPAAQPTPVPEKTTTPVPVPKNSAHKGESEFFTVQFLTSSKELQADSPELMGMKEVMATRNGTLYCYSVGRFATFTEANEYAKKVQQTTSFKDAWALRRQTDKVQTLAMAPKAPSTPATPATPAEKVEKAEKGTFYRVQFCTSHTVFKVGDSEMHGIKDFRSAKSGQVYIYTAGNYKTLAEAKKRCATIKKSTPFKDAFVVCYKNGKRIIIE